MLKIDWSTIAAADRPHYAVDTRGILDANVLAANGIALEVAPEI